MGHDDRTKVWTLDTLIGKVAEDLQKLVRLRAADDYGFAECVSCGAKKHWKQLHGGHFVSGRSHGVVLDERNVWPQCRNCNYYKSGNQEGYLTFMLATFGIDVVEAIKRNRHRERKWTRPELLELRAAIRKEIRGHEIRLRGA
jgi:hypothetical protein